MDNFRRSRKPKSSFGDMDGFVRRSSTPNHGRQSLAKKGVQSYQPVSSQQADTGMKRQDGFFPRRINNTPNQNLPDGRGIGRNSARTTDIEMTKPAKKKKKRFQIRDRKKFIKRLLLIMGILLFIVVGFLLVKGFLQLKQVFGGGGECTILECEIDPSQLKGEGDGRVNILLLGRGGEGHEGPDLTDTILVASIDPINNDAGLLSLPRDMYVQVPGNGSMKINSVFYTYKQQALNEGKKLDEAEKQAVDAVGKTVSEVIGIPIHRYGIIDFKGFEKAVNTVGGVDIEVKKPVFENMRINGGPYVLDVDKGWQHFDGKRALAYSRSRYTSARGDFDRAERQREVLVALRNKVLSLGTFSNPVKISGLLDTFGAHVKTNLSIDEMRKLYELAEKIDGGQIKSISLVDPPNDFLTTANLGGLSIVQPKAGINNYDAIRKFVRNEFKDGFIRKENPGIVVLNGTSNSGAANNKAEELKGYGYNVISVGNAPNRNTPNTILVDLRDGEKKYTKRYLELRFKTTATTKLPKDITPPENADFVIIVGQQ